MNEVEKVQAHLKPAITVGLILINSENVYQMSFILSTRLLEVRAGFQETNGKTLQCLRSSQCKLNSAFTHNTIRFINIIYELVNTN